MSARPGWYPDPAQPGYLRRWDGHRWTEETRLAPLATADQAASVAPAPDGAPQRADEHGFRYAATSARAKGLGLDALLLLPVQALITAFITMQIGWQAPSPEMDPLDPNFQDKLISSYTHGFDTPLLIFGLVTFFTFWVYYQVGLTRYGTTLGGRRARVQCVNAQGDHPSSWSAALRYLVWGVPTLVVSLPQLDMRISAIGWVLLLINYGWAYFGRTRQALMDKIARTYVIAV